VESTTVQYGLVVRRVASACTISAALQVPYRTVSSIEEKGVPQKRPNRSHVAMSEIASCSVAAEALRDYLESCKIALDHVENVDVGYISEDSGRVDASVSVPLYDLIFRSHCKRVEPGGEARFLATSHVHQGSCIASSIEGVARVVHAQIELVVDNFINRDNLAYAVSFSVYELVSCVNLIVAVPVDLARGSEVILRRVCAAGYDVTFGDAPLRVTVGFNHSPTPVGRVTRAARAGDIPALKQALDDGCSTLEADGVRAVQHPCTLSSHLAEPRFPASLTTERSYGTSSRIPEQTR
jgi:hypothetical protein